MEDDLNFLENGRRPQFFGKWKTTSNKIMQPKTSKSKTVIFLKMEDDLNFLENGRRPYFFGQRKTQQIIKKIRQPETLKIKTMVVAPLRVT